MIFHRAGLKNALRPIRALLCDDWDWFKRDYPDHLRDPLSQNMCFITSAYLYHLFTHVGMTEWKLREGHPFVDEFDMDSNRPTGGMLDRHQKWQAHTWLEHDQGWILDLTADQFGYAPIIITKSADYRYKHNLPEGQILARLADCKVCHEWLEHHQDDGEKRQDIEGFRALMNQTHQMDMVLSCRKGPLEEAAL